MKSRKLVHEVSQLEFSALNLPIVRKVVESLDLCHKAKLPDYSAWLRFFSPLNASYVNGGAR
jgi:hypothetical protein